MIEDLRTDYKSDILMPVQQDKRTFNILDSNNNILYENVHIEDNSQYLQVGDEYGSDIINAQNTAINTLAKGTGLTFNTYQDYLDAKALGEVPVGSIIYIKEGNSTVITANQVTYNDSNVKLALDTVISRIAQINDDLTNIKIGYYNVSGTTDSYGSLNISSGLPNNALPILVQPTSYWYHFPLNIFKSQGGDFTVLFVNGNTTLYTPLVGASVSAKIYYIQV